MSHTALGLRHWADTIGLDQTRAVLAAAAVNVVYFNSMANYLKPCTPAMFERIERAAIDLQVAVLPDYETCTRKSVRQSARAAKQAAKASQRDAEQRVLAEFAARRATTRP